MPAELVFVRVKMFVAVLRMETSAPTSICPLESVTAPVAVARSPCAKRVVARKITAVRMVS